MKNQDLGAAAKNSKEWPLAASDMAALGYLSDNWAECRGCGKRILWTINPHGHRTPIEEVYRPVYAPSSERFFQPHHINCPRASQFRRERKDRRPTR